MFLAYQIKVPSLSDTDTTCSKDSIQGTQGFVRVSESPRSGGRCGRFSEWATADTAGVVDGQTNGSKRAVGVPNGGQSVRRCYHRFGIVRPHGHM